MKKVHQEDYKMVICKMFIKLILQIIALVLLQLSDMAEMIELVNSYVHHDTLDYLHGKLMITSW